MEERECYDPRWYLRHRERLSGLSKLHRTSCDAARSWTQIFWVKSWHYWSKWEFYHWFQWGQNFTLWAPILCFNHKTIPPFSVCNFDNINVDKFLFAFLPPVWWNDKRRIKRYQDILGDEGENSSFKTKVLLCSAPHWRKFRENNKGKIDIKKESIFPPKQKKISI